MKWIARVLVFVLALVSGYVISQFLTPSYDPIDVYPVFDPGLDRGTNTVIVPDKLTVSYIGVEGGGTNGKEPYLVFMIFNGTDHTITYEGYSPLGPIPEVKVNGTNIESTFICRIGFELFYIPPKRAAEVHVQLEAFTEAINARDKISVGFNVIAVERGVVSEIPFSQPFQLTKEFRDSDAETVRSYEVLECWAKRRLLAG